MKFDKNKAFPFPVLRPGSDDFKKADFQSTVELCVSKNEVKARIEYHISCKEIVSVIKDGLAEYVSVFGCRDTYYRELVRTSFPSVETVFAAQNLRGEIRVDSYVLVKKRVTDFKSRDINSEFGLGPFLYNVGSVLAQDEPQIFYIEKELFSPITSVFDLVKKEDLSNGEWTISFADNHVQIEVSPEMKQIIGIARNNKDNRSILLNSIYFSAVAQAVQKLKDDPAEFEDRKWADVITKQAHNKGCDLESHDAYLIAQRLMHYPLQGLGKVFTGRDK